MSKAEAKSLSVLSFVVKHVYPISQLESFYKIYVFMIVFERHTADLLGQMA